METVREPRGNFCYWKQKENQLELELNGTHQLLAYADDENLMEDVRGSIKRNAETLIVANKEVNKRLA
jgi:hypothetical protein